MTAPIIFENENDLFLTFLSHDAAAVDTFTRMMAPRILRTARSIGRDLPDDIHAEIVQQTFANLLITQPTDFDPSRGTAWQFLIGKIWNAEKQVRTSYGYPLRRKQQYTDHSVVADRPKFVSVDAAETMDFTTRNYQGIIEGHIYVATVMRRLPTPLASALRLICYENKTKNEAAKLSGLSRFQLHRQLAVLRSQFVAT